MIPLQLKLKGFLSYRDPVTVDFTTFKLACISGQNGAGKSSLLDAITWVLFGQARKSDDTLINSASDTAEVIFTFQYEGNAYQVRRIKIRGKSTILEFTIKEGENWRVLTEATVRATQLRIETILRLDYDTFVNASFFLQGKADQFTQQKASERKHILSNILGLELWETYRERTAERRKVLEYEITTIEGRMAEINAELSEETTRKMRLKELETELALLRETRKSQEVVLGSIKVQMDTLKRQREQVEKLNIQILRATAELNRMGSRQTARETEQSQYLNVTARTEQIHRGYQAWQTARAELENWNNLAEKFRVQEKVRQEPLAKIGAEQARLEHERDTLARKESETAQQQDQLALLEIELAAAKKTLADLEAKLAQRSKLEQSQAIIAGFREQAKLRQAPLDQINSEKARLEQQVQTLEKQQEQIITQQTALKKLQIELAEAQGELSDAEIQLNLRKSIEQELQNKKERQFILKSGNDRLKLEMETLEERINSLEAAEGALCPVCGQPLSPAERQKLVGSLRAEGKEKGDEYRRNKSQLESILKEISSAEKEIVAFGRVEKDHLYHVTNVTKISERIESNEKSVLDWSTHDAPRLEEISQQLETENYSLQARQHLARIDRELQAIGKALGVKVLKEISIFDTVEEKVEQIESELNTLKGFEDDHIRQNTRATQLAGQINTLRASTQEWQLTGKPRLAEINAMLTSGAFSLAERSKLAEIDQHLRSLGYDAAIHDTVRQAEQSGRSSENELRELESARSALVPLERELLEIQEQLDARQNELGELKNDSEKAQKILADLEAGTPDLYTAESVLLDAQERENKVTGEVGAARQKVNVLADLRLRKTGFETKREDLAQEVKNHKTLERAFGKDGVPALLIEQALPQIEEKANELLDRLSNGSMNVRFVTQAEYKDKKRDDLKETLDIQISDGAGTRDYEMFSGGEAFRVNFAIRLALSEVLARRTGARLQTLVIDEGFGSQDTEGRQRLIEAINQVKTDFDKILIITHLEELKEAFPNRIEVEKTPRGSSVRVL